MKHLPLFIAVVGLVGCGRVGVDLSHRQDLADGAPGGGGGAGGATGPGAGGQTAKADAGNGCVQTAFSTAPVECPQDWTHAQLTYKRACKADSGGYQASCAPYDAIAYVGKTTNTWCFYATGTGNLIASLVLGAKGAGDCKSFDFDFVLPDVGACAAVSGGVCGPDAGR